MRAALYARVSTSDQTCENQLLELRRYAVARGWTAAEYVDAAVSGAKDRRPALDGLLRDATAPCGWRRLGMTAVTEPLLLTVEEVASLLRTSPKAVYALAERRQIGGVTRIGRRLLFRREVLLDWLRQKSTPSLKE